MESELSDNNNNNNESEQKQGFLHDIDDNILKGNIVQNFGSNTTVSKSLNFFKNPLSSIILYANGMKSWSWWFMVKIARVSWVVGTSILVFGIPLLIEVSREETLHMIEQQKTQELLSQGYTKMQIDNLIQSGQLGIPPPVPKPQLLE